MNATTWIKNGQKSENEMEAKKDELEPIKLKRLDSDFEDPSFDHRQIEDFHIHIEASASEINSYIYY